MSARHFPPLAVAFAIVCSGASVAGAGGQFVGDNGSAGMQRAGAFVARADDPTALYYNPAGLANIATTMIFFGTNVVRMSQQFERAGSYQEQPVFPDPQPDYVGQRYPSVEHAGAQPVPFLASATPLYDRIVVGAGVFAPQGAPGRDYPTSVSTSSGASAPAPQRYDAVSQEGGLVLPSLAVGVALNDRIRIGGRASWGVAWAGSTKTVQGQPSVSEQPEQDSTVTVDARDWIAFTWGAGLHVRATDALELGVAYSAPVNIRARGSMSVEMGALVATPGEGVTNTIMPVPDEMAQCEAGGTPEDIRACISFSLPQTATIGARWVWRDGGGRDVGDVELDVRWENWSAASDYRVVVDAQSRLSSGDTVLTDRPLNHTVIKHGTVDVVSVRLGGARSLGRYVARGGVAYDSAAVQPSWTRVDFDGSARVTLAGGIGVDFASMRLDLGAAYVHASARTVQDAVVPDVSDPALREQPDIGVPLIEEAEQPYHPFNAGTYDTGYAIGSLGLTAWW